MNKDRFDSQVRTILPAMLKCVKEGLSSIGNKEKSEAKWAMDRLEKWDSEFGKDSVDASIFEAWELMLTT